MKLTQLETQPVTRRFSSPDRLPGGWLAALVAMLALFAVSCGRTPSPTTPKVLAQVGPVAITVEAFEEEAARRLGAGRPILSKEALLQEMVREELLVQRARGEGLEQDPEFQRTSRNLLIGLLRERELTPRLRSMEVDPAVVQAHYEANLEKYTRPAKVRLAILQRSAGHRAEEREGIREGLEAVRQKALALPPETRGFGALSIRHSEDQVSRYKGGDIGWVDLGRERYHWPKEVIEAGAALASARDISGVIEAGTSLYLVMKLDTREPVVTPFSTVEAGIERRLLAEKRAAVEAAYLEEARQTGSVRLHANVLDTFELPAAAMARTEPAAPPSFP